jgi:multidrug efflux pump subunit AcrB
MWLVNTALRHPYTVQVGMILVFALGLLSFSRTPTDILPTLKAPVVVVFSSYRGMPAPDMEQTVTRIFETALTKCDHLDHIESRSLLGISIIQVYFRPNVSGDIASSQVIALVNGEMQNMPPGMLPPTILNYDASSIPVGNLVLSSATRDDKYLLDLADHQLRDELAGLEGLASAPVFGGVFRQVQIYVQPRALESLRLSPMDVARIVNSQSQVIPTGEIRIGKQNYYVRSNAMARSPEELGDIPILNDGVRIVRLKDVANVVDGTRWRTNIVRVDGRRAVYLPLLRQAGASAVRVVDNVQGFLSELRHRGTIPDDVEIEVAFDQSQYVRDALANLRYEALVGAVLASLVVLLFLGSLRTTWIVALSIPLSLLAGFVGLYFLGETLNIMTLGGLALVLGRVIDDSVVDVENTVRHLRQGKTPFQAALDSAHEISIPVLMATVTTVIVFLPLVFMTGMGKYLFTPLAVSVALALFASYLVSRTVSPLMCARYLKAPPTGSTDSVHASLGDTGRFPLWLFVVALLCTGLGAAAWTAPDWLPRLPVPGVEHWTDRTRRIFEVGCQVAVVLGGVGAILLAVAVLFWIAPLFGRLFARFVRFYEISLRLALRLRWLVLAGVLALLVPAWWAFRNVGQELFPDVDSSEFTLHVRASGGPRVEETERQIEQIENLIQGEEVSAREFLAELVRTFRDEDTPYLNELRQANPAAGPIFDQLAELARDPASLTEAEGELGSGKFTIPGVVPPEDLALILSNVGLSSRWSSIYTPNNGPHSAFLRVQLRSGFNGRTTPASVYVDRLRERVKRRFPAHEFFFETGGMIRRILNNGSVAPVEIQVAGQEHDVRRRVARLLHNEISRLAVVQDSHSPQGIDLPELRIVVDRERAAAPGLSETDIIRNVITALMSSSQLAPNFWIDPKTGNPYVIGVQYPEYVVEGIRTLEAIPVTRGNTGLGNSPPATQGGRAGRMPVNRSVVRLEDVATIEGGSGPVEVYHYQATGVSQLFINMNDPDLGGAVREIEGVLARFPLTWALEQIPAGQRKQLSEDQAFMSQLDRFVRSRKPDEQARLRQQIRQEYQIDPETLRLPPGVRLAVRGEVQSMRHSFNEMGFSLLMAVLLVYLVMAAQFASWIDPLIMIVSAPLGLIGVAFTLWLTGTSLNIQSCMGVLMMAGISVSNSVLVVEFANRQRRAGLSTRAAVVSACCVRLRPILMTTVATLVGLAPMAIHRHPGDEMNLPLARAVIGGLLGSTLLTLIVVPVLYVLLKPRRKALAAEGADPAAMTSAGVFSPSASGASSWGEMAFLDEESETPESAAPRAETESENKPSEPDPGDK